MNKPLHTKQFSRLAFTCVAFLIGSACERTPAPSSQAPQPSSSNTAPATRPVTLAFETIHPNKPVILIHRFPGRSSNRVHGTVIANWSDGRIAKAESDTSIGGQNVCGHLTTKQMQEVIEFCLHNYLAFPADHGNPIIDASSEFLGMRIKQMHIVHRETIGSRPTIKPNATIAGLRELLFSFEIEDPQTCDQTSFVNDMGIFY